MILTTLKDMADHQQDQKVHNCYYSYDHLNLSGYDNLCKVNIGQELIGVILCLLSAMCEVYIICTFINAS